ncbi:unnamed protein product [Adineta steineri]|uniref:Uncharacterized protein n=1 Tax=Adineta steineri TaxID=433720 RepID=A0A818MJH2_9BILA|nr:unnamed protein product [Adineta steineri]CAF3590195.1 unnamed protein product [Adineta steineri]
MFNGHELNVNDTIRASGLLDTINSSDGNYPELRLKFLHKLHESAHIATNIVLTSPEELVYKDIFEVPYSPTQEEIMPDILKPLVEKIHENQPKSSAFSSKLVSMPVFTKQVVDELPSLHITVPVKPNEFDSNEFLQCLAMDLGIN